MLSQEKFTYSAKSRNKAQLVRAQVDKFVSLVQKKSIKLSQENRRARVRAKDVYRALWLVTESKMPHDRPRKLSKGRGVVTKVHVRQERQRKEIRAGVMAVVARELEALRSQSPGPSHQAEDQIMETDRSPQSEAAKSSNSVEMRSTDSSGPSASVAQLSVPETAAEAKMSSPDELSVDLSPEKCESISIAEVIEEDQHHGGTVAVQQNVVETLYDVKEPESNSSASNMSGNAKEAVEADEVSSKHAESLPDDDVAEKFDSGSEVESEPRYSEDDSMDRPRLISRDELVEDETMNIVTEQLAETNIQTERKLTPKRGSQRSEEEMPAKIRPASSKLPQKEARPQSLFPGAGPIPPQGRRTPKRLPSLDPEAPGLSEDSPSTIQGVSGWTPTPTVAIVVTPPEEEPENTED